MEEVTGSPYNENHFQQARRGAPLVGGDLRHAPVMEGRPSAPAAASRRRRFQADGRCGMLRGSGERAFPIDRTELLLP
ncbi:hypothetical protein AB0C12_41540 [Actinoplanes sp. NPDC048967]|uniref:hypothetical protein n=1 Tax=Actinoplanes sp. NPDC048967 TaxID=3155269 RepID=UPI0033F9F1DB